ncbi:hypothetical protein AB1Y20_021247 [Prymnesium parvum]|uniref:Tetrapyrrole biosynthesis uroporphyrinogen III synthase domain-containing protein n=1 Tax=Prymnesium parvum TaxID=97485 RepID=A0AB34JKU6_PRYPA
MAWLLSGCIALSSPFAQLRHSQLALADKRILITAPRVDAAPLVATLLEAGAHPLWCPTVRVEPLSDEEATDLDDALMRISEYDVLLLADRHALDAVAARGTALADGNKEVFTRMLRGAAVDVATAAALSNSVALGLGTPATVIPFDSSAEGMAHALALLRPNARVVLPTPHAAAPVPEVEALVAALESSGASVSQRPAYKLADVTRSALQSVEFGLLKGGGVDAVCVGSAQEVHGLCEALGSATGQELPFLAVMGKEAVHAAERAGLSVGAEVDPRTSSDLDPWTLALSEHFCANRLLF